MDYLIFANLDRGKNFSAGNIGIANYEVKTI